MAELVYDKDGRLLFTKEMKKEYTILMPMMLPVHFTLMRNALRLDGYKMELLTTSGRSIVEEGLKNVHNDSCYPALLVIGQFIDALKSGKYDPDKVALIITQTGGGCRASNYIHLLRKALERAGYPKVPVISLNLSGLEKNPGFKLNYNLTRRIIYSMLYGDLIMLLANQCRPYEVEKGATDRLVESMIDRLTEEYKNPKNLKYKKVRANLEKIMSEFAALEIKREEKIRVGIVGEIFIKYAALGNNNLEEFLLSEDVETVVPGLIDFAIFKVDNRVEDAKLYGGQYIKKAACGALKKLLENKQHELIDIVKKYPQFRAPEPYSFIKGLVKGYLGYGNKMGEGWLLTGEMLELIHSGTPNIICAQPFGCLPNHIVGKGMIRKIRENNEKANIVAIDYDPGATRINQENRIKLMLANARLSAEKEKSAPPEKPKVKTEAVSVH
ncbi:MAG TPA: 2-hydroxyglutaryl-CoA dehydratase [Ruminiclostridium sp.]|nr:2-hydroxyglutaryl-CoA dehydratase [Ruminiclostridium sp.]